ncbi:MAG: alpha-amylase family glycosyl hydrolase [Bacteroidetes bacterium]|nr:alpha-amylase family glycosyl hydrolase [Bacteroidota bacterium]
MKQFSSRLFLSLLLFFSIPIFTRAQVITTTPSFPLESDSVTIIFDATQGSGGLAGFTGDVYAHTGVITNNSVSSTDWKYVKTKWGQNTPGTKLTRIGTDLYTLKIRPSVRNYYGVASGDTVLKMAFVFRSDTLVGSNYLEGKMADGGDLFANVYQPGIQVSLTKPSSGISILNLHDTLTVGLNSIFADSVFLYVGSTEVWKEAGDTLSYRIIANGYGKFWVKGIARNSTSSAADSFYFFVRKPPVVEPLPAGIKPGINYTGAQDVTLCLYAPQKSYCFVLGDFNDWQLDTSSSMKVTPDSNYFWIQVNNLEPGKEYIYQYFVDGSIRIGDPYAEKVSDPWNDSYITSATYPGMLFYPKGKTSGIATVLQINAPSYAWKTTSFTPPEKTDMVVYELLVRDFTEKHTFQAVIDTIKYLKHLGINAVELMPVNEFEGNSSWGYNTSYYFAVDKYYGPKNDLKKLIDTCHQIGMAVILDVVYNHSFGTSPYVMLYWDSENDRPSATSPFYNPIAKHDYNVGYDMNHKSPATKQYISRALKFWLSEFRVDGFRFDLSKGFTQKNTLGNTGAWGMYDASRIAFLAGYADTVWKVNPKAFVILEHFAENTEEKELSNRRMMLWGNSSTAYQEAAMGYNSGSNSDFSAVSYKERGWSNTNLVGYMESHDEERLMYKCLQYGNQSGAYDIKNTATALLRMRMNALFFFTIPGPKMFWQFGELGYDYTIDYNGRTGEKPIRWDYYSEPDRHNLNLFYSAMIRLKQREPLFSAPDFQLAVESSFKRIQLHYSDAYAVVLGNFHVASLAVNPAFPHTGRWYEYLTGDSLEVTDVNATLNFAPGEYHLYLDKKIGNPDFIDTTWAAKPTAAFSDFSTVYPNPSSGAVYAAINTGTQSEVEVRFEVYNDLGQAISSFTEKVSGYKVIRIDGKGLKFTQGVYILRIKAEGNKAIHKIVIK